MGSRPWGPTQNWISAQSQDPANRILSAETLLELMRELPEDVVRLHGTFELSADKEALIVCDEALYVIPLQVVSGFEMRRTLPAKGGAAASCVPCGDTGYAKCPSKTMPVARGSGVDDLNEMAGGFAAAAGKPFTLGAYDYDC